MNQQCQCTHPIHTPAVVVGGRYVVATTPQPRSGPDGKPCLIAGDVVRVGEVTSGKVPVTRATDGHSCWIDPRHLTPAPDQPVEAPANDDDLLRDLGATVVEILEQKADHLLSSEPMQRLRAAWTAEAVMTERMEWNPVVGRQERLLRQVGCELDEARAAKDLHKERQQELEAALNAAVRERDDARAERDRVIDERNNAEDRRDALAVKLAEVERLRTANCICGPASVISDGPNVDCPEHGQPAAKQSPVLPQVHTAERRGDYVYVNLGHNCGVYETREGAADMAALGLAALGVFDAEAADTSSDDEVRKLAVDLYHVGLHTVGPDDLDNRQLAERLLKLGWHRARGGQEAGQ